MGKVPSFRINLFILSLLLCHILEVWNTFVMGLLLGILETCYSSTTLTAQSLLPARVVLFPAPFAFMEWFWLVATSYKEYLAVCHPLLSVRLMNCKGCLQKAIAPWLGGFLSPTLIILFSSPLHFVALMYCTTSSVVLPQYWDNPAVAPWHSCSLISRLLSRSNLPLPVPPGILWVHQSFHPGAAFLPSVGWRKALSTCSPHLTSVTLFYSIPHPGLCNAQDSPTERQFDKTFFLHHPCPCSVLSSTAPWPQTCGAGNHSENHSGMLSAAQRAH